MAEAGGSGFAMAELARMRAAGLKQRREADQDLDATLLVLAEELGGYSATVVQGACREWARTQVWWPTLAELRRECEERAKAEADRERRLRLPRPGRYEPTHDEILERMEARYGWTREWIEATGLPFLPAAVKRDAGGVIVAFKRAPHSDWQPVQTARQNSA